MPPGRTASPGGSYCRAEKSEPRTGFQPLAGPLRPLTQDEWQPLIDTSNFAGILAGVIYDPDAAVGSGVEGSDAMRDMALFGADHDFAGAVGAGLGYEDRMAEPGKTYQYFVSIAGSKARRDGALVKVTARPTPVPVPVNFDGAFENSIAKLRWNREAMDTLFVSYQVELRVGEGGPFRSVTELPLVQLLNESNYDSIQYHQDTLTEPDVTYYYRVRGRTPFGIFGPPSEPVAGRMAFDLDLIRPRLTAMDQNVNDDFRFAWTVPPGNEGLIRGFQIMSSGTGLGGYRPRSELLPADARAWLEPDPRNGETYLVAVVSTDGRVASSPAQVLLTEDLEAPEPPTGLTGSIDTSGRVVLNWNRSVSEDARAYRVYFSNLEDGHYSQVTGRSVTDTFYLHDITMETTTEAIFFRFKTVDFRGNISEFSEVLALERPDLYPPTPASIISTTGSEEGVRFEIAGSASEDVAYQLLLRSPRGREDWQLVDTLRFSQSVITYRDATGERGTPYRYRVLSVDDDELYAYSQEVESQLTDTGLRGSIEGLSATPVDGTTVAQLQWKYAGETALEYFKIMRAEDEAPLRELQLVDSRTKDLRMANGNFIFFDRGTTAGHTYTYRVMARHYDGGYSPLSDPVSVTIR